MLIKQQFPKPTVGVLIFNPEGKIFLMKSHKWWGKYVIPGGHIELGEKFDFVCRTKSSKVTLNSERQEYIWAVPQEALQLPIEPYTRQTINEFLKQKVKNI